MFPTNTEHLISVSDAFSAFVYEYRSSCPNAHCTPNKSVPTLHYTRRPGPVYTGHACRHLSSAVTWISEDRLFFASWHTEEMYALIVSDSSWCRRWNLYDSYAWCVSPTQKSSNFSLIFPRSCISTSCSNLNLSTMPIVSSPMVARNTSLWNSLGSLSSLLATQ